MLCKVGRPADVFTQMAVHRNRQQLVGFEDVGEQRPVGPGLFACQAQRQCARSGTFGFKLSLMLHNIREDVGVTRLLLKERRGFCKNIGIGVLS